jgi:hypothetical protein
MDTKPGVWQGMARARAEYAHEILALGSAMHLARAFFFSNRSLALRGKLAQTADVQGKSSNEREPRQVNRMASPTGRSWAEFTSGESPGSQLLSNRSHPRSGRCVSSRASPGSKYRRATLRTLKLPWLSQKRS